MTAEYEWIERHVGVSAEEKEHTRRLNALREELARAEGALSRAVGSLDVDEAAKQLPRRDALKLIVAEAARRVEDYERGREHARELADRSLSRERRESERARASAVSEGRSLRRGLEEMAFAREAAQNQRANGGADWDALHSAERARVESRLAHLRETFNLTDWEVSDASEPAPFR